MKRKFLLLGLLSLLLLFQTLQFSKAQTLFGQEYDFLLEVNEGGGIGFQGDNTIAMAVTSGLLNGSSCSLSLDARRGSLGFLAMNDSTLQITSPDAEEGFDISISGASASQVDRFIWNVGITANNQVIITWSWRIESWIGDYTLFALGISGLILMIASPTWCAMTIQKKGLAPESFEMIMYALLIMCVGFGLVVMWLW